MIDKEKLFFDEEAGETEAFASVSPAVSESEASETDFDEAEYKAPEKISGSALDGVYASYGVSSEEPAEPAEPAEPDEPNDVAGDFTDEVPA